jgi:hypothetical protein
VGEAEELSWWAEGRPAMREEVVASVDSGYPILETVAREQGPAALAELARRKADVEKLYPPALEAVGA